MRQKEGRLHNKLQPLRADWLYWQHPRNEIKRFWKTSPSYMGINCAGFLEDVVSGRCAAAVTAARCDTASADEAAAVLGAGARRAGVPPITSIINSGGVLADAILSSQTAGALLPKTMTLF